MAALRSSSFRRVLSPNNLLSIEVAFDRNGLTLLEDDERNEHAGEGVRITKMFEFGERWVIARYITEEIRNISVMRDLLDYILRLISTRNEAKQFLEVEITNIDEKLKKEILF